MKLDYLGTTTTNRPDVGLTFHWATVDGIPECVGLDVRLFSQKSDGSKETLPDAKTQTITATLFRTLPVAHLVADAMHAQGHMVINVSEPNPKKTLPSSERRMPRLGPVPYWTPDRLEEVAATYKQALATKRSPTKTVAKTFNLSHSMASKLVRRCRDEGLLGKTRQGKAGGAIA